MLDELDADALAYVLVSRSKKQSVPRVHLYPRAEWPCRYPFLFLHLVGLSGIFSCADVMYCVPFSDHVGFLLWNPNLYSVVFLYYFALCACYCYVPSMGSLLLISIVFLLVFSMGCASY